MTPQQLSSLNLIETKDGLFCQAAPVCRIYQVVLGQVDFRNLFMEGTLAQLDEAFGFRKGFTDYELVELARNGVYQGNEEPVSVFYRDFVSQDDLDEYQRIPMECELFHERLV